MTSNWITSTTFLGIVGIEPKWSRFLRELLLGSLLSRMPFYRFLLLEERPFGDLLVGTERPLGDLLVGTLRVFDSSLLATISMFPIDCEP
jgi:hypothetical protein